MITCTKRYDNFPFAHRQHMHEGHCRFIHGHNWSFEFEFVTQCLDANGFVIDFGKLKWLKDYLTEMFDHTLLLNRDDPALNYLQDGLVNHIGAPESVVPMFPFADIRVVPNAGAEGLAKFIFREVSTLLEEETKTRSAGPVRLKRVTVFEDDRNSATFAP